MRIIFVRHGYPDYKTDCLTELGHRQADAAGARLADENVKAIYASTRGRAMETAEHIARATGAPVIECDFMREISWGSFDDQPIPLKGQPWYVADDMIAKGQSITDPDWMNQEPFCINKVVRHVQHVTDGFDAWLAELGYRREGLYYRVCRSNPDTVAVVSHGGSSSAAIAHLFNVTFPLLCGVMRQGFAAVTTVALEGEEGALISPSVEVINDTRHTKGLEAENVFGK